MFIRAILSKSVRTLASIVVGTGWKFLNISKSRRGNKEMTRTSRVTIHPVVRLKAKRFSNFSFGVAAGTVRYL